MIQKLTLLFLMLFLILNCKKESSKSEAPVSSTNTGTISKEKSKGGLEERDEPSSPTQVAQNKKEKKSSDDSIKLEPVIDPNTLSSTERLLEYHISVSYKTKDFANARKQLIQTVKQYGIIQSSSSSAENGTPYMNMEILVKTDRVYDVLLELDKMGDLTSENIRTTDLTESKAQNQIRLDRELMREKRRDQGLKSSDTKTWKEREEKLSQTEDVIDKTKMDEWKLKDRISWAKLHVVLRGPEPDPKIDAPSIKNTLVYGVNAFIYVLYGLLFLLPFFLAGWGIWYLRKKAKR